MTGQALAEDTCASPPPSSVVGSGGEAHVGVLRFISFGYGEMYVMVYVVTREEEGGLE